ncbi:MAG: hypothetical protein ACK2UC_13875 [Anaerolineae bacterium]|jgi:hypothetical protein
MVTRGIESVLDTAFLSAYGLPLTVLAEVETLVDQATERRA